MKPFIFGVLFLMTTTVQAQGYKCFAKVSEPERKQMVSYFMNKKYPEFKKSFEEFCKKNESSVTCKTETVKLADAPKRMSEISRQSICSEVMRIDSDKNTTIYALDDKGTPKRN
ncbi:hypothetical protein [Bdellovibrio sp. HCB274]|uniref:hypothetical protein n=1 Tax=Bdellovibrio sp. HCB274 TaxID=3394361 RepID=UPI0039B514A2